MGEMPERTCVRQGSSVQTQGGLLPARKPLRGGAWQMAGQRKCGRGCRSQALPWTVREGRIHSPRAVCNKRHAWRGNVSQGAVLPGGNVFFRTSRLQQMARGGRKRLPRRGFAGVQRFFRTSRLQQAASVARKLSPRAGRAGVCRPFWSARIRTPRPR